MPPVRPDRSTNIAPATRAHYEHLFGRADGCIEILTVGERALLATSPHDPPGPPRPARRLSHDGLDELLAGLPALTARALRLHMLVAVGMLPRARCSDGGSHLLPGRAVWCDADLYSMGAAPGSGPPATVDELRCRREAGRSALLTRLRGLGLPPSVVVDSGWGRHLIWYLADPTEPAEIVAANRAIAAAMGVTDSTWDAARMLRAPGSWNSKVPSQPKLVRITRYQPDLPYDADHLRTAAARLGPARETTSEPPYQARAPDSPEAAPSAALDPAITAILDCDPAARALFRGAGKTGGDLSDSGYDISLVLRLMLVGGQGLSPDALAGSILHRPRRRARDLAYARRTVAAAMRWHEERRAPNHEDEDLTSLEAPSSWGHSLADMTGRGDGA